MDRRDFLTGILARPVVVAILLGGIPCADAAWRDGDGRIVRRLRFSVRFQNPSSDALPRQTFWCYLPLESGTQTLRELKVSMPYLLRRDALGHRILQLELDGVHGFFQKQVFLEETVAFDLVPLPETVPDRTKWLSAQRFIEIDAPQIRALAEALNKESDDETIKSVYRWVAENLSYAGYLAEDMGALYAATHMRGDCTEYAALVVALLRVNGIPARMVGGYVADTDIAPKPQDYHDWAEVFVHGAWQVVDAQKQNLFPRPGQYVAFRIYTEDPSNDLGNFHRYRMNGTLRVEF